MHVEVLAIPALFGGPPFRSTRTCWPLSGSAGSLSSAGNASWRGGHSRQRPPVTGARPRSQQRFEQGVGRSARRVEEDQQSGLDSRVSGTPTFYIDGIR